MFLKLISPETALRVSETIQKKSESAKVTHRTIISVIILTYSLVRTTLSESMLADRRSCRRGGQRHHSLICNTNTRTFLKMGRKTLKCSKFFFILLKPAAETRSNTSLNLHFSHQHQNLKSSQFAAFLSIFQGFSLIENTNLPTIITVH